MLSPLRFGMILILSGGILATSGESLACPFCPSQGKTLAEEVSQANLIVFGTLSNPKRDPNDFLKGTTDMSVEVIVKDKDGYLKGKKSITLPRYVPPDPKNPLKYLVFCDVYQGTLDPYRGEAVTQDSKIAEYLKGALDVREKDPSSRLLYFFKYLDSPEMTISIDALMEFGNADYKDFAAVAPKFPPTTVVKWLKDPETPASRYGLYGSMLGHCGSGKEHASVLRELLDDPKKRLSFGMDGVMAGYVMLAPKEGWKYVTDLISNPENEFLLRYAALRTVRFFWDFRQDIIPKAQIIEVMTKLIEQSDIADLPIDDLRRWGIWELSEKVLSLYDRKSHNVQIVKRAIVRFALSAPATDAKTKAFVERVRKERPDFVKEIEHLLELEKAPAKDPNPKKDPVPPAKP